MCFGVRVSVRFASRALCATVILCVVDQQSSVTARLPQRNYSQRNTAHIVFGGSGRLGARTYVCTHIACVVHLAWDCLEISVAPVSL